MADYLHNLKEFPDLLRILGEQRDIDPYLIEKDYWMMHVLYGLKTQGFNFEPKGGTSLSKGYKIIERFSEDIDIHIKPPSEMKVEENPSKVKASHIQSRKDYYYWLVQSIKIDGIADVQRDHAFDNENFKSGGIRLMYTSHAMLCLV